MQWEDFCQLWGYVGCNSVQRLCCGHFATGRCFGARLQGVDCSSNIFSLRQGCGRHATSESPPARPPLLPEANLASPIKAHTDSTGTSETIPLQACMLGCLRFWCLCSALSVCAWQRRAWNALGADVPRSRSTPPCPFPRGSTFTLLNAHFWRTVVSKTKWAR